MCFSGRGSYVSLVGEHMSLVIRVYLVGICNSLLVEEHISLGICVSLVGEHSHVSSDMGKGKTYQ